MRVLLATLGGSWQVVPELYGFTNPEDLPLYSLSSDRARLDALREQYGIRPVNEIWLVTTAEGSRANDASLRRWAAAIPGLQLRICWPEGMADIVSVEDARRMADLIFRLALHATERGACDVYVGIAGGRKTMSADLQRAGEAFGWGALLHVVDRLRPEQAHQLKGLPVEAFLRELDRHWADAFLPVVVAGMRSASEAIEAERDALRGAAGSLPPEGAVTVRSAALVDRIEEIARRADSLVANYRLQVSEQDPTGGFRALYALPARVVRDLHERCIGADRKRTDEDLAWLRRLPKAELHCHLGGILSPAEMVEVAGSEAHRVGHARQAVAEFERDLREIERWVRADDLDRLARFLEPEGLKGLRTRWSGVPEPVAVCGFLLAFAGREALVDAVIYEGLREPKRFCGVGIERYESLGDLQGSGLLQSEATLRATVQVLARQCSDENIRYLELRCSPMNYTRGGLAAEQVISILLDALDSIANACDVRLMFIASRHGERRRAADHVQLAIRLLEQDARFRQRFVGFDLAGAEHVRRARDFRDMFRPLHERVVRVTIHAGEGEDPHSIWEAVYDLAADRIGHGLTLGDAPDLLARFRDRRIALEMCPSSNYQIVGYRDHLLQAGPGTLYPLRQYLDAGLHVTVNTDDPGISRTCLSAEYLKAAAMTQGGLSRWDVLRLIRNGFRAAFSGHGDRRGSLLSAERELVELLASGGP